MGIKEEIFNALDNCIGKDMITSVYMIRTKLNLSQEEFYVYYKEWRES